MSADQQIINTINDILRVDGIEEAFSCFLVHRTVPAAETFGKQELQNALSGLPAEQQESAVKQFISRAVTNTNYSQLQLLLKLLEEMVADGVIPARMVCESLLYHEKLQYKEADFWNQSFQLIRKIIGGVDYKGVREIMKVCFEKAHTLPRDIPFSEVPQLNNLEALVHYIFDRNACLLPAYFIANELQKGYPEGRNWPHWRFSGLMSKFVGKFRETAQMVSIIGHESMRPVVEHSGYADYVINPWKLDPTTLKFSLKGNLPYQQCLLEPQTKLLRYVLEQPYSRDMVCSILGLQKQVGQQKQQKQRCVALEEQLVELVIFAMERSEVDNSSPDSEEITYTHWLWLHLSSQLIYFVLFQFATFPTVVAALHSKLANRELRKGRDHLMWVLLQYISGSIQRNPVSNFLPVLKLYDLLYPEREPLPLPDVNKPLCTHQMAVTCIWVHLLKKAQLDQVKIRRPIPYALKVHHDYLQHLVQPNNANLCMGSDYRIALLCNAYSTNTEFFNRPMQALVDTILGSQKGPQQTPVPPLLNNAALANGPTTPLSMSILDSLTVHSKMSLIHAIVTHVIKLAQAKSNMALSLAPALVETYSRLLVYTEIESLGIKGFISQLLPTVFKSHAWGILYTLLEMFSYRMHHIQPHYRVQLLSHLHNLAAVPQTNQTQLHLCVESTALRLITGLGSAEVQPQLSRFMGEPKTLVSAESEELNRALVLTIARSMHVTGTGSDPLFGSWCKELLNTIMQNTPHNWANHTLQSFPPVLNEFFQQNSVPKANKQQLKKAVEEEYRNWASMNNENDIIAHFSVPGTPALFLCLLWKMIMETDRISPIAYKILERIGARALSSHLRNFCDYIVFEFVATGEGQVVNKCVDAINSMVWKYNIITIDRLVLCLVLRTQEGNEAQVCFFIIQLLLLKAAEFRSRVQEFVKENSPEHWKQSNWHEKHLAFHRKYPEKFAPEGVLEQTGGASSPYQSLPVYFGNVCLRFLPVCDIMIHRYLELPPVSKSLEILLDHLGCLYKFHDRPVTYLYNTLHYYERNLRDRPALKRRLVSAVLSSLKDIRAPGWSLSEPYTSYMTDPSNNWEPNLDYYIQLVRRIVHTIEGTAQFPATDWRFNEFPNSAAHALYMTCVELMAVPVTPTVVGTNLLDVIARGRTVIPRPQLQQWINSIALLMAALPDSYWSTLHDRLLEVITLPDITNWSYINPPFQMFNYDITHHARLDNRFSYTLAIAHAMWHHAGIGQIATISQFVKEKLSVVIKNEEQFLFLCHLVGPFLQRLNIERPQSVVEITSTLYHLLEQVDKIVAHFNHMESICDLLYHIKYMFVGDSMRADIEGIIRRLRPALQMRLRFIAHLNIDEITDNVQPVQRPDSPTQ